MGVVSLTQYLNSWGAIAVVGVLAGAKGVGIYNVAASMGGFSAVMLVTFSGIFNPIVSDLYSRGMLDDLASLYQDVCSWIFTATLPVFLLTLLLARDIMAVFGDKFVTGWPVLVLIASAQLFNSSVGPTNRVLAMTGNQRVFMLAILGSAIVSLGGSAALVPLYGIIGAGVATAAGVALLSIATVLVVHRLLEVWPYNRQYVKPLIAGGLPAGVVFLVRSVFPLPEGLPAILVFSPLFLLGFAALRLALGLSANDRRFVAFVWTAMRRNRAA
jgi:O-antigen/teichoic acid export membrane protein